MLEEDLHFGSLGLAGNDRPVAFLALFDCGWVVTLDQEAVAYMRAHHSFHLR